MQNLIGKIQKRVKGILLLAMLVIPFFLYAAARSGSVAQVYVYLALMTVSMAAAMRYAWQDACRAKLPDQIVARIEALIKSGGLKVGDQLPPEK